MEDIGRNCKAAAGVLGARRVECSACPFPFCVVAEAGTLKAELNEHVARIMHSLGRTMDETAEALGMSARSIYRYVNKYADCTWCRLIRSQQVLCKSNTYTVVQGNGTPVTILNWHRQATMRELSIVMHFIEYVFPSSVISRNTDGHDYWTLDRVELEEAKNFQSMCDALNRYTLSLNRGVECPQQIR